ncbi:peptidoglycan-binding domain-containing protein [Streptomyces sp. TRM 70351]|uniref:peptidoglycan-binding domain-containing protein n=1 Tax=Streptomyces sp. TRM 70351 TaxID=3116552 RepID=UPI002E7BAD22|nr:peptidoglycan-binding domain-containing protein [Streptomyces sp. TRM 70351]MEE1928726.1 peptidoglycan-binding domain-containing protein [Streptomyces sp. TRM 70351]
MRAMTRALVSVTTAVGIAAGSLAAAGTSFAAAPETTPVASTKAFAPLAVVNLGLTTQEASMLQYKHLRHWGYTGALDGQLGTNSWKAMQRQLRHWGYNGAIDGIVGTGTVKALQRFLKQWHNYNGAIDGIAGSGTIAAFKRMARVT